jgi:hypothetical protein
MRREGGGRGGEGNRGTRLGGDSTYVGGFSDSSRARISGGSSRSLNACWVWLAENGISVVYCVDMLT